MEEKSSLQASGAQILRVGLQYWEVFDFTGEMLRSTVYATPSCNNDASRLKLLAHSISQIRFNHPVILIVDDFLSLTQSIPGDPEEPRDPNRRRNIILRILRGMQSPEPLAWDAVAYDNQRLLFCGFKQQLIQNLVNTLERAGIAIEKVWPGFLIDYMRIHESLHITSAMIMSEARGVIFYARRFTNSFKIFNFKTPEDLHNILQQLPEQEKTHPFLIYTSNNNLIEQDAFRALNIKKIVSHLPYQEWDGNLLSKRYWIHIIRLLVKIFRAGSQYQWLIALVIGGYFLGISVATFKKSQYLRTEIQSTEKELNTYFSNWKNFQENPKIFESQLRDDNLCKIWQSLDQDLTNLTGVFVKKIGFRKIEETLQIDLFEADWVKGPALELENSDRVKSNWHKLNSLTAPLEISLGAHSWRISKKSIEKDAV